jgi:hypothetical protein
MCANEYALYPLKPRVGLMKNHNLVGFQKYVPTKPGSYPKGGAKLGIHKCIHLIKAP